MKKCGEFIMGVGLLLAAFLLSGPAAHLWQESAQGSGQTAPVVVLDAGHGGDDPGKIGINKVLEKDINLSVTLKTKALLEAEGVEVVLTRKDENGLYKSTDGNKKRADLNRRCNLIEESGADFVVSIHQNSYRDGGVRGAQVFYYKDSEEGKKLAEAIQNVFNETISSEKKRAPKANGEYYMLLHVSCPIVIAECGFLSNWEEAERLKDDAYQDQVAEALAKGILSYLSAR